MYNDDIIKNIIPKTICFRVTKKCNMKCPFCQAPENEERQMSIDEILVCIKKLSDSGIESIKITGGEPFAIKEINKIIQYTRQLNVLPIVCTNGTIISSNDIEVLKRTNAKVKVSMHGTISNHNRLTNSIMGKKIIDNVKKLIENGIYVSLHTLVDKISILDIEEFIEQCIAMKIKKVSLIAIVPRGRGKEYYNETCLKIDELRIKYNQLVKTYGDKIILRLLDFSKPYYVIENDARLIIERSIESNDTLISENILYDNRILETKII